MAPVGVKKRYEDERSELFIAYEVLIVEYTKRSRAKSALSTNLTSYIREL